MAQNWTHKHLTFPTEPTNMNFYRDTHAGTSPRLHVQFCPLYSIVTTAPTLRVGSVALLIQDQSESRFPGSIKR